MNMTGFRLFRYKLIAAVLSLFLPPDCIFPLDSEAVERRKFFEGKLRAVRCDGGANG
jgi:hypothetical protein